jgi:hypothetical protein
MLPFLLLSPVMQREARLLAIGLIVFLHAGFGSLLTLGVFGLAMCAFTPNLLGKADLDALERWAGLLAKRTKFELGSWLAHPRVVAFAERLGAPMERATPERRAPLQRWSWLGRIALFYLMLCALVEVLVDNHAATHFPASIAPRFMRATAEYLQLKQGWSMYAPDAPTTDMNLFVDAITVDRRRVDPWNEAASPSHPNPGATIPPSLGQDAMHYAYVLRLPWQDAYHRAFSEWILRYPERTGRPADEIASFEVSFVEDDSPPPGEHEPRNPRQKRLFKYP